MANTSIKLTALAVGFAMSITTGSAIASGSHDSGHDDGGTGSAGDAGHVDREIMIEMGEMYFSPVDIEIRKGETIRFIVKNVGEFVHEFNIATEAMHLNHSEEMMMMIDMGILEADKINSDMMADSDMAHSDPNSLLLEPNENGEVIWTFSGDATLELSCNVPGHRESGMFGPIVMTH
jgi:uncharacterized cupredoxin-like copper-binding protein